MKSLRSFVAFAALTFAIAASASLNARPSSTCAAASKQISGTIYGFFDPDFEGAGAWVGYALISIDGAAAKVATFADRNTELHSNDQGVIWGAETISLQFEDGSGTLDILGRFQGTPQSTPALYFLDEVGKVARGTGTFAKATGCVTVRGPFLLPDPAVTTGSALWIAEIHGKLSGVTK